MDHQWHDCKWLQIVNGLQNGLQEFAVPPLMVDYSESRPGGGSGVAGHTHSLGLKR